LKVTGSLPIFVSLKDFFLVDPTTTFPKSQTYVEREIFSRLTGPVIWKLLCVSWATALAAGAFTGASFAFPVPLADSYALSPALAVAPNPEVIDMFIIYD